MTENDLQEALLGAIRQFVSRNFLFSDDMGSMDDDASFLDAGIIDSTGVLELISHLEHAYGIEVADEEMLPENFDSISRIAAYLTRKLDRRPDAKQVGADRSVSYAS